MIELMQAAEKCLQEKTWKALCFHLMQISEMPVRDLESKQVIFLQWFVQYLSVSSEKGSKLDGVLPVLLSLVLEKSIRNSIQLHVLEKLLQLQPVLLSNGAFELLNERIAVYFLQRGEALKKTHEDLQGDIYISSGCRISPTAQHIAYSIQLTCTKREESIHSQNVAVVIPIYHCHMTEYERISFMQCFRVLSSHEIIFVAPNSLRLDEYIQYVPNIKVVAFPDFWFRSIASYNRLLLSPHFYEKFTSFSHILIYQLDAFVFEDKLHYYCDMEYDYFGAVWFDGRRVPVQGAKSPTITCYVGNGGFSLRHVEHSLRMLESLGEQVEKWPGNEDIFWSLCGELYPDKFKVAPVDIAEQFSFELAPRQSFAKLGCLPFGCHAWAKYDIEFFRDLFKTFGYHI